MMDQEIPVTNRGGKNDEDRILCVFFEPHITFFVLFSRCSFSSSFFWAFCVVVLASCCSSCIPSSSSFSFPSPCSRSSKDGREQERERKEGKREGKNPYELNHHTPAGELEEGMNGIH